MMLNVKISTRFKKDVKQAIKRGLNTKRLDAVIEMLATGEQLPPKYRDHLLENSRNYQDLRECHIQPDWLLIYQIRQDELTLFLVRTGTHSDLF